MRTARQSGRGYAPQEMSGRHGRGPPQLESLALLGAYARPTFPPLPGRHLALLTTRARLKKKTG
jgi:hypothetical protein